jgi:hypothetical protein
MVGEVMNGTTPSPALPSRGREEQARMSRKSLIEETADAR